MIDPIRLEQSRFFSIFLVMKEVKTCQECGIEFRSKMGFSRHKKGHSLSLSDTEMTYQFSPSKIEEIMKLAANKIADEEDVLQELKGKIIAL